MGIWDHNPVKQSKMQVAEVEFLLIDYENMKLQKKLCKNCKIVKIL